MAKEKVRIETPPSTAPGVWKAIRAIHWQSHGGKWAAPQHYNCTYMAMFPPELPHYFIKRFTKLGDTVLDPFSGRGTTAVEASAQGRIGIGNDLNPLAVALSRGKISNPRLEPVLARLKELEAGYDAKKWKISKEPDKIKMIYHPNTLSQLCYLKANLDWSKQGVDAFLVSVLMGAMHGQSSGFLSVSMPNTFSMGWNYVKKYIKEKNLECPDRDVFEVLDKRVKRYLKKGYLVGSGKVIEGDVRDLDAKVEHDSVQLLFTSPPYLKVIKYGLYNWIRLWFLTESGSHEEVDAKLDDTHALNEYLEFMKDTLTATLPLLDRKRGLSCWAIGDVKGLNLAWAVWHHAGSKIEVKADDGTVLKYKLIAIVEDKIPDNQKVSKIWKTLAHHVEYVNETDEVVESIGQWETEKEAKAALKKAEEKEDLTLKIRVEKTNDKSGKATPTDRILIIAPESSKPKAFMKAQDLDWEPFHVPKGLSLKDFTNSKPVRTDVRNSGNSRISVLEPIQGWDWPLFFKYATHLGKQLNQTTWRFLKAEVLGHAMEMVSHSEAKYVDEPGYDLELGNIKIEVKTHAKIFTNQLDTIYIRMKNTMGETQLFEKTFDYLLVANTEPPYVAAIATWDDVYKEHRLKMDVIESKIKKSDLQFVTPETGIDISSEVFEDSNLKNSIIEGIREWLAEIKEKENSESKVP